MAMNGHVRRAAGLMVRAARILFLSNRWTDQHIL